jgi:hypothetical protein
MTGGFTLPEYGNADDFFSPLTSPALEAQAARSSTGTTASPIDMNSESLTKPTSAPRRGRRKGSISTRTSARSVKLSPAVKAVTRRKGASLGNLSGDKIDAMIKPSGSQTLQPPILGRNARSSDDSVSPEPLSEALMGPPPVPLSTDKSPWAPASQSSSSTNPVTPATLMMLPSKQNASPGSGELRQRPTNSNELMEDIQLPDAVSPAARPSGLRIDVGRQSEDDQSTPTMSAKSAKLSATSTPRSAFAKTGSQDSFSKSAKAETRGGGRGNKKRQSTSSAAISPALRPKISPSITPLVPASGENPGLTECLS